jgi:hypothetical protein
MSKITLTYKSYLATALKIFTVVNPVAALLIAGLILFTKPAFALAMLYIALIVLLLVITYKIFKKKMVTIDCDEHGIKTNAHLHPYDSIVSFEEVNDTIIITFDDQKTLKINEHDYEQNNLLDFNDFMASKGFTISSRQSYPLASFDQGKALGYVSLLVTFIGFAYIIGLFNGIYNNVVICTLLSLVLPFILAMYYIYLLKTMQLNIIEENRMAFLMGMLIPAMIGWAFLFFQYNIGPIMPIIVFSIVLLLIILVYYHVSNKIKGITKDMIFVIFLIFYIPFVGLFINNEVTLKTTSSIESVAGVNVQETRFVNLYSMTYKKYNPHHSLKIVDNYHLRNVYSKYDSYKIRISKKEYRVLIKTKNPKVKIDTKTGLFGIETYSYRGQK